MIILYIFVGGVLGLIVFGELGLLLGALMGVIFGIGQSLEKKISELQHQVQNLEFKINDEIVDRKDAMASLAEKSKER